MVHDYTNNRIYRKGVFTKSLFLKFYQSWNTLDFLVLNISL